MITATAPSCGRQTAGQEPPQNKVRDSDDSDAALGDRFACVVFVPTEDLAIVATATVRILFAELRAYATQLSAAVAVATNSS